MANNKKEVPFHKRKVVIILVVFISVVLVYTLMGLLKSDEPSSVTNAVKNIPASVTGKEVVSGVDGSAQYNKNIKAYNQKQAEIAEKNGESFTSVLHGEDKLESFADQSIETPINISGNTYTLYEEPEKVDDTQSSQVSVNDPNYDAERIRFETEMRERELALKEGLLKHNQELLRMEQNRQAKIESSNKQRIERNLENRESIFAEYLANERNFSDIGKFVYADDSTSSWKGGDGEKDDSFAGDKPLVDKVETEGEVLVEQPFGAGDVLYAVNRVAINTDFSAKDAVIAEVISQDKKLNGIKFIGGFDQVDEYLAIRFNRFVTQDGSQYPVQAYAISEETISTAVRSDVNHHTIERWALLLAGTAIESMAENRIRSAEAGNQVLYDDTGAIVSEIQGGNELSLGDELIIAGGKVVQRSAGMAQSYFERKPTVTLEHGQTIGIAILEM